MAWRWPWRQAEGSASMLQPTAAPDPHWHRLPPIQRAVDDIEPTAPLDDFTASLTTAQNPGMLLPTASLATDRGDPLPVLGVQERPTSSAPASALPQDRTWRPALNLRQRMLPAPASVQRAQKIPTPPADPEVAPPSVPDVDVPQLTHAPEPAERRQLAVVAEPVAIPHMPATVVEPDELPTVAEESVRLADDPVATDAPSMLTLEPTTPPAVGAPTRAAASPTSTVAASPRSVQRIPADPSAPSSAVQTHPRRHPENVVAQRSTNAPTPLRAGTPPVSPTPPEAEPPTPLLPETAADVDGPTVKPEAPEDASAPVPGAPVQRALAEPVSITRVSTDDATPSVPLVGPVAPTDRPLPVAEAQRAPEVPPHTRLPAAPVQRSTVVTTPRRRPHLPTPPVGEGFSPVPPVMRLQAVRVDASPTETAVAAAPPAVVQRATTPDEPKLVPHAASRTLRPTPTAPERSFAATVAPRSATQRTASPVAQLVPDHVIPAGAKLVMLPPVRRSNDDTSDGAPEPRFTGPIFESQRPMSLQRMFEHTAAPATHRAPPVATPASTPTTSVADRETPGYTEIAFEHYTVQREAENPGETEPVASAAEAEAPSTTVTTTQPPAPAGPSTTNVDELVNRIYDPLAARLRAELWLDRERAGVLMELHR